MPETKEQALARAKSLGLPASQVVASVKGNYYIAPRSVTALHAKQAYANCMENGGAIGKCVATSSIVQNNHDKKHHIKK